jgi:hypothetical protein
MYFVCAGCKEGKFAGTDSTEVIVELRDWVNHHATHGVENVIGPVFLSEYLRDGYIDVDREDLEPIVTAMGESTGEDKPGPYGTPGKDRALANQREMQRKPIETPLSKANLNEVRYDEIPKESPVLVPREPNMREMQLTLPWSVKYSRDYRANPQTHKDFAHALTHVVKAAGKLAAVIDDYDHRRETVLDPKAKDYLADLVICAMRMANTAPGGMIDLFAAVQARVIDKNFTNVKKVVEEPEVETIP